MVVGARRSVRKGKQGKEVALAPMALFKKKLIAEIENFQNYYPQDVFKWSNKEALDFNRGRFNKHCHEIVENVRNDMIKIIKEI